LQSFLSKDAVL